MAGIHYLIFQNMNKSITASTDELFLGMLSFNKSKEDAGTHHWGREESKQTTTLPSLKLACLLE